MRAMKLPLTAVGAIVAACLLALPAHAQASRTWVSGVGDDANPCSRTAPCKTFAGAISKTADGGEIDCLDPGGFGAVTITKSVTIDCGGTFGSVLVSGTSGIVINSGATPINVVLRNIAINGLAGSGLSGVRALSPGTVLIENVRVFGFGTNGIDVEPASSNLQLAIKDSTVHSNTNGGILVKPVPGASVNASLTRVNMYYNLFGIRAEDGARVSVFQSTAADNGNNGFLAISAGAPVVIDLVDSLAANTGLNGIATSGAAATIRIANTSILDNNTGINTIGGGTVTTTAPATNLNAGNATAGSPNASNSLQ
jgi:hypothetical protein